MRKEGENSAERPTGTPGNGLNASETVGQILTLPLRALKAPLYSNAFFLMVNTGVSAALGAAFWLVAARYHPASEVGLAAALIPLATFLSAAATLGLGFGLIRFLPENLHEDAPRGWRMVNVSLTVSIGLAAGLSVLFLAGAHWWTPSLAFVRANPLFALGFVLITALLAARPLLNHLFVALRKTQYALGLSLLYGVRIPLPIVLVGLGGAAALFLAVGIGGLLAAAVGAVLFLPLLLPGYRPVPSFQLQAIRPIANFSLGNHVATLVAGILSTLLPLMVVELRSPQENAWFYIAWFLGNLLYMIPVAMSTSLFAEGSQLEVNLVRDLRRTVLGSVVLLVPAGVVLWFVGDWLLGLFGTSYAVGGFGLLRWLVLASPFVLANQVYFTLVRIGKRVFPIISGFGFIAALTLGISFFLLPGRGLEGIGIAHLVAQGLFTVAVVADLLRQRHRRLAAQSQEAA